MGPLTRWPRCAPVVRALDRATGAAVIAFGARLALESAGRQPAQNWDRFVPPGERFGRPRAALGTPPAGRSEAAE